MDIELVKPKWIAGSERRFLNFIKGIKDTDKIAIISHTDADGVISAKVASKVLKNAIVRFAGYNELNEKIVSWVKENKINKVFMCDLSIEDYKFVKQMEKIVKLVIVDHHTFEKDLNNKKTVFLNAHGFCASYLSYYLFSKVQDLEKIDWLVACASVADWAFFDNAEWMDKIYKKYGEKFNASENLIKTGKFWDLEYNISLAILYFKHDLQEGLRKIFDNLGEKFGEIGDLEKYSKIVHVEIAKGINDFYINKEDIKDGYFIEFSSQYPIKEVVVNILASKTPNKTFIVAQKGDAGMKVSARRQDGSVNLPELLKKLIVGFEKATAGGHIKAAGTQFPLRYYEEFKKRVKSL